MPYLDEQGLETLVKEIKDYALQKTSAEYSEEFSFTRDDPNKTLCFNFKNISQHPFLLIVDFTVAVLGTQVFTGTVVLNSDSSGFTYARMYNATNNQISGRIFYDQSEEGLKLYFQSPGGTNNVSVHVKGINTGSMETTLEPTSINLSELDTISDDNNILNSRFKEVEERVNTLETTTGGSTSFTPSKVVVTSNEGNITTSSNITTTELNYLDGVSSNIQTQLDNKATSTHSHKYAGSSSAGGSATSAVKLQNKRSVQVDLNSTSSVTFDGTSNITPGVKGVLPIANGGTGSSDFTYSGVLVADEFRSDYDGSAIPIISTIDPPKSPRNGALHYEEGVVMPFFSTLPISCGGTEATTRSQARMNLGINFIPIIVTVKSNSSTVYSFTINSKFDVVLTGWAQINEVRTPNSSLDYTDSFIQYIHTTTEYSGKNISWRVFNKSGSTVQVLLTGFYIAE